MCRPRARCGQARARAPRRRHLRAGRHRAVTDGHSGRPGPDGQAGRSYGGFEGRSSVRTWLYQIATNACLTSLARHQPRLLPSGLGGPEPDGETAAELAGPQVSWLQPIPDAMLTPDDADPAVISATRDGVRLALIASLQYLPPRQRAVLILRDVLAFPAAEVALMVGTTTASVKSALQRARARLRELAPAADEITEPTAPHRQRRRDPPGRLLR